MLGITLFELAVIGAIAAAITTIGKRQPVFPVVHQIYNDIKSYWYQERASCLMIATAALISILALLMAVAD